MDAAVFVADAHLDEREESVAPFLRFLETLPGRAERLCLLGDIFNLWVAFPSFESRFHRRVLQALAELPHEGVAVFYVEGNREFFLEESDASKVFSRYSKGAIDFEAAGRRVRLFHGDRVNLDDRRYLLWNRLSKSRAAAALARAFPSAWARPLAESLERRMRSTNLAYKVHFPEPHALRYAKEAFHHGRDAVVLGHFHDERRYDEKEGTLFVMPMWGAARRVLRLAPSGEFRFAAGE